MPVSDGLYYSEHRGDESRPLVVLIHGAGSSHLMWPSLMRRLSGWSILALDLPGHGRSTGPGCTAVAGYANRVIDFLLTRQVRKVVIIGHSLGGAVALLLAFEHAHVVAGLGVISGAARLRLPPALQAVLRAGHALPEALREMQALGFSPHTPQARRERMLLPLQRANPVVLAGDWQAAADFDLRSRLSVLDMPAWLAVGQDDRLTGPAEARFLKAFLPRASLQVIPRAGHFLPLEQPAALSAGFQAFLGGIAGQ